MKCANCTNRMRSETENYAYTACGLPGVVLLGVEVRHCDACGKSAAVIPNIEGLHRLLARAVAEKPARLLPQEIRFLRKWLGFSGIDFARIMGKQPESVSRWESVSDPMKMDPSAERLLRLMVMTREPIREYPLENLTKFGTGDAEPVSIRIRAKDGHGWATEACLA